MTTHSALTVICRGSVAFSFCNVTVRTPSLYAALTFCGVHFAGKGQASLESPGSPFVTVIAYLLTDLLRLSFPFSMSVSPSILISSIA